MLPFSSSIRNFLNNATVTTVAKRIDETCDFARALVQSPATYQKIKEITAGILLSLAAGSIVQQPGAMLFAVGSWSLGFSLIKSSRIIQLGEKWLFQNQSYEDPENEPQKIDAKCIAKATLGSALFLYGSYTGAPLVSQILNRAIENLGYTKAIESLVRQYRNCSEANALWQTVEQEGAFSIYFYGDQEPHIKGMWYIARRIIRIHPLLDFYEKIAVLLFELNNANQTKRHTPLIAIAKAGLMGLSEFVRKTINIEYLSKLMSVQIATICTQNGAWHNAVLDYSLRQNQPLPTFEEFFSRYVSEDVYTWHRQHYAAEWLARFQAIYCKNNPFAPECAIERADQSDAILLDSIAFDLKPWQCPTI